MLKERRFSMPAIHTNIEQLENASRKQSEWRSSAEKLKIKEDLYLTDRTVPKDDPRIMKTMESIGRIRKRTNFDPNLIKNKCWAAKVCKDLTIGLAKVDGIELERKRMEVGCVRSLEAEKLCLRRRLERMNKTTSKTKLRSCGRSHSIDEAIVLAYRNLHKCVDRLSLYCNKLEAQGGFITEIFGKPEEAEVPNTDVFILTTDENNNFERKLRSESLELPEIHKTLPANQVLQKNRNTDTTTRRRRVASYSEGDQPTVTIRSPSLPIIGNEASVQTQRRLRRVSLSAPYNLCLMN